MKMKRLAIITILIFRTVAYSENLGNNFAAPPSWIPRPMVLMGPSLMGSGYQNMALNGGAGLLLNSSHVLSDVEGCYMNARKTNDNTFNNSKGHERYLQARA
jgi:hypothetical protein